ncbi:MAG TPA: M13 family metallopeptidase [Hyphomonadaceae bacterium]|nr:M13 family metallopeptidase [Hyphomonadaceae bacterium]
MRLSLLLAVSAAALITACSPAKPAAPAAGPAVEAKAALGAFGIDTVQMDTAVKPGDDFFKYVNGKWIASTQMPADKSRYGEFDKLRDKSENDVHAVLEALTKTPPAAGTVQEKVLNLYNSWMDEAAIEARGIEPLKQDLANIEAAKTKADINKLIANIDYSGPFGMSIQVDPSDTTKYSVFIGQAGLGMPVRDYYLAKGEKFDGYRAAYKVYVTKIFELIGDKEPAKSADAVIGMETKLANIHWAQDRRRDVQATNNPTDLAGLKKWAPAADWDVIFKEAGLADAPRIVVAEKSAVIDGAKLLDTVPVATWQKYLAFHLASDYAAQLPKAFDDASFAFFGKTLRGQEVQRDRWKRGVGLLDGMIGEGVGELYVAKYFPQDNKAKMDALVANLRTAMGERLKTLSWMDEPTRAEALKKLGTFDPRVGYPVKWRDYSAMTVEAGKLFENVRNGRKFEWNRQASRINSPVDRAEWGMNPQTVNAYYDPPMNQITFPAAILQPPFFDPNADPAVNYGAIGAVIGHEMGHGFDDQGREYDEAGKIRNWWSKETNAKFVEAIKKFGAQYNAFCPLDGACVNGSLTMGENIGDLGGLEMAYTAYHLSLGGKEDKTIDGFTGDQRFFMAHAQVWRQIQRDDALRNQMLTDPHSPGPARGSIPEKNIDAWYTAFDVKEGDKNYLKPEDRVHIW